MTRRYEVLTATLLFLACSALSYATPNAYGQKLSPKKSLVVVDANGKKVGNVIGTLSNTAYGIVAADVALAVGRLAFVLRVDRYEFSGALDLTLIFGTPDCSGPAFLLDDEPSPTSSSSPFSPVVVDNNNVAFVGDRAQRFQTATMGSFRYPSGGSCNSFAPELRFFVPTLQVNLNVFTPPFSAR